MFKTKPAAASAENMIAVGLTVVFIWKPCSIPINLTTAAAKGAVRRPVTTSFTQIDVDGLTCTQMNRSLGLTAAPRRRANKRWELARFKGSLKSK